MKRRGWTRTEWIVVIVLTLGVCFLAASCGGPVFPFEFILMMAIGWMLFLNRVRTEITPDWYSAATGARAVPLFTGGLHLFCRWLYATRRATEGAAVVTPPQWKLRWTFSAVTIVLLLFVAGIAMVGITHQIAWMATSPEPIIGSDFIAGRRAQSQNNLKQQAIAVHNYHDDLMTLPPGLIVDSQGRALHGWQTLILPYVEQKSLYEQIDLARPWSAESQKPSFASKVKTYTMPARNIPEKDAAGYALSHYAANQNVIGGTRKFALADITDGTANTILAGEAAGNFKPWGHPRNWRDPALGINASPDGFGSPWPGGANIVMADGSVHFVSDKIDPAVLRALSTPAAGDKTPDDF